MARPTKLNDEVTRKVVQAIRAGAKGYVTKSSPPEALVRAAFDVLQGRIAFSAALSLVSD